MKVKFNPEVIMVVVILILTAVYIVGALRLPPPIEDGVPTQSLYPWIIIGVMFAACTTILFKKQLWKEKEQIFSWERIKKPVLGIGILGFYIILFTYAGYWISTPVFSFSVAMLFEYERKNKVKALIYSTILGIIVPLIGYLFFEVTFAIRLPKGVWF